MPPCSLLDLPEHLVDRIVLAAAERSSNSGSSSASTSIRTSHNSCTSCSSISGSHSSSGTLRLVCKRFLACHDDALTELTLRGYGRQNSQLHIIMNLVSRCSQLKGLSLHDMTHGELAAAAAQLVQQQQLNVLRLDRCEGVSRHFRALAACTALQQLTLAFSMSDRWEVVAPQLEALTGLRSLAVASEAHTDGALNHSDMPLVAAAIAPMTHLTRLSLGSCGWEGEAGAGHVVSGLASLRELALRNVFSTDTVSISALTGLDRLVLECVGEGGAGHLSGLTALSALTLGRGVGVVGGLDALSALTGLRELEVSTYNGAECLPYVCGLGLLRTLRLPSLPMSWRATERAALARMTQLQALCIQSCKDWEDLAPLATLVRLTQLHLGCCEAVQYMLPLTRLTLLADLALSHFQSVRSLTALEGLTQLSKLSLRCINASSLQPLTAISGLEQLTLEECEAITSLAPLRGLSRLKLLEVYEIQGITSVAPLSRLTSLQHLNLGYAGIVDYERFASLTGLRWLCLTACPQLTNLVPLAGLVQLQELDLSGCTAIANLQPLAGLLQLRRLELCSCPGISSLEPLRGLTQLRQLDIGWCTAITDVSPLAGLSQLRQLRVVQCCEGVKAQGRNLSQLRHYNQW